MSTVAQSTQLPPVNSRILDRILAQPSDPMHGTDVDWWSYLVEQGLSLLSITSSPTGVVAGSQVIASLNITTNTDTALAIYAIMLQQELAALAGANDLISVSTDLTYYQPSPPAANDTTLASLTGNLRLRNNLLTTNLVAMTSFTTSGAAEVFQGQNVRKFFVQPPLVVGPSLVIAQNTNVIAGTTAAFTTQPSARILGRYVRINTQQYANLVALATGEAILPPTILG